MSEAERAGTSRQDTRQDNRERLLAGRYRLGKVLGRGGMGTVWRAEDETLGRTVAVKELRFPSNIDEDEKRRLITRTLREAKAIARIRNNSAVTVFDVVEEDDRPWIVMELVEGKSLAEFIREDGLLKPRRAAEVGLAILDVLRSAHREGILHRDVKPSNVLLESDTQRVVLTDFGIAQVEGDPSITSTGMLVGAPSYISPERARGHKPGPAADLWSLGGLLYAAVEGVPPYDKGSAIATLTAVMTEQLEEPKNAGPLTDVIYGLLTKDPAKRLDDAGARAMLNAVIHAPESKAAEPEPPADATRVVPLPVQPDGPEGGRGSGAPAPSGARRPRRSCAGRCVPCARPPWGRPVRRRPLVASRAAARRVRGPVAPRPPGSPAVRPRVRPAPRRPCRRCLPCLRLRRRPRHRRCRPSRPLRVRRPLRARRRRRVPWLLPVPRPRRLRRLPRRAWAPEDRSADPRGRTRRPAGVVRGGRSCRRRICRRGLCPGRPSPTWCRSGRW